MREARGRLTAAWDALQRELEIVDRLLVIAGKILDRAADAAALRQRTMAFATVFGSSAPHFSRSALMGLAQVASAIT